MNIEIELPEKLLIVELSAKIEVSNDSFDHEFGTETYPDYYYVEEFEWDKEGLSEEEIQIIKDYVVANFEVLSDQYVADRENNFSD